MHSHSYEIYRQKYKISRDFEHDGELLMNNYGIKFAIIMMYNYFVS